MQGLQDAIEFIRALRRDDPNADKAVLQCRYVKAFHPRRQRSVLVGNGYALRFSQAAGVGFANTVLSLSALRQHDERPFVIVVVRPDQVDFLLANSTFLRRASHSSQALRVDNVRGSFNGTDILTTFGGVANAPAQFETLFAMHEGFSWEENLERLVQQTNAIAARERSFVPTEGAVGALLSAPDRARAVLASLAFARLEGELQARVAARREDILSASAIDNVKLRGEAIERLLAGEPSSHDLGDLTAKIDGALLAIDIKTKLLDRKSAPKAYNVDKALEFMSRADTVLAFLIVGIDRRLGAVTARLLPVLESGLIDSTTRQPHWAGRSSRGTTQLTGDFRKVLAPDYLPKLDVEKAKDFIRRLLES